VGDAEMARVDQLGPWMPARGDEHVRTVQVAVCIADERFPGDFVLRYPGQTALGDERGHHPDETARLAAKPATIVTFQGLPQFFEHLQDAPLPVRSEPEALQHVHRLNPPLPVHMRQAIGEQRLKHVADHVRRTLTGQPSAQRGGPFHQRATQGVPAVHGPDRERRPVLNEQRGREHFRGPPAPLRFTGQQLLRLAQLEDVAHPADAIDLGGYGADRCAGGSRRQEAELDTVGLMAARLQDLGVQAGDSSLPHLLQQSLNAGVERVGGYLTGGYGAVVQQVPTDLSGDGGRTVHRGLGAELAASDDMMGTVAPGVLHEVGQISLQDIDDMSGAVTEIARILADDCPLVLAIVHPMYSGGKFAKSKFSVTFRNSNLFIIKRSYFQSKRLVSTDMYGSLRVTLFREHRPLQVYTKLS
jgi:hypothetical protein